MLKSKVKEYFQAFESKNLNRLSNFFLKDIFLVDWENEAYGIQDVLLIYEAIFKSAQKINICPVGIYVQGSIVIAEIFVNIDDHLPIKVVDIIEFSSSEKIKAIRAYKR